MKSKISDQIKTIQASGLLACVEDGNFPVILNEVVAKKWHNNLEMSY